MNEDRCTEMRFIVACARNHFAVLTEVNLGLPSAVGGRIIGLTWECPECPPEEKLRTVAL